MANMTLDRLVSAAGAVAAGADDWAHGFGGESESRLLGRRPPAVLVAIVLLGLAGLLVLVGVEATDPTTARDLQARALAHDDGLGQRTYATISGSLAATYASTYVDLNGNDRQDDGEADDAWYYWLVDPGDRSGVTVRSERPPSELFTSRIRGVLTVDPGYVGVDKERFGYAMDDLGLTLEDRAYVDGRDVPDGTAAALDLGAPLPSDGTVVEIAGPRIVTYLAVCPGVADESCGDADAAAFDIVVYDPVGKRAITVVTRVSPAFTPATMTGVVHRDERTVDIAQRGGAVDDLGAPLDVSSHYVLDDGAGPSSSPLAFLLAAVLAILGGTILVGAAGGYLLYRRTPGPLPAPASTLDPGARLPLRVTGYIQTPAGRLHVREAPADLLRFVLRPAVPAPAIVPLEPDDVVAPPDTPETPDDAAGGAEAGPPSEAVGGPPAEAGTPVEAVAATPAEVGPPAEAVAATPAEAGAPVEAVVAMPAVTTLVIERTGHPQGVSVGVGQLTRLSSGTVTPTRGPRPALRAVAGTGRLLLSFDTAADRDRAAAELLAESGLGPDGRIPTSA